MHWWLRISFPPLQTQGSTWPQLPAFWLLPLFLQSPTVLTLLTLFLRNFKCYAEWARLQWDCSCHNSCLMRFYLEINPFILLPCGESKYLDIPKPTNNVIIQAQTSVPGKGSNVHVTPNLSFYTSRKWLHFHERNLEIKICPTARQWSGYISNRITLFSKNKGLMVAGVIAWQVEKIIMASISPLVEDISKKKQGQS